MYPERVLNPALSAKIFSLSFWFFVNLIWMENIACFIFSFSYLNLINVSRCKSV